MTFYKSLFPVIIIAAFFFSCGNSKREMKQEIPSAVQGDSPIRTPGLPIDKLNLLKASCDLTDIIFFDLPISMSQDTKASIHQLLQFIKPGQTQQFINCNAVARMFFVSEGETLLEGDLHFSKGCKYFVFYEDGQPKWANGISPAGESFFQQVIASAQKVPKAQ